MLISQESLRERAQAIRPMYKNSLLALTGTPTTRSSNLEIVHIEIRLDSEGTEIVLWDDILCAFKDAINIRRGIKVLPFLKDKDFKNLDPLRFAAVPNTVLDVLVDDPLKYTAAVEAPLNPPQSSPQLSSPPVPESLAHPGHQLAPRLGSQSTSGSSQLLMSEPSTRLKAKPSRRLAPTPALQPVPHPTLHSILLSPSQSPPPSEASTSSRADDIAHDYLDNDEEEEYYEGCADIEGSNLDDGDNNTTTAKFSLSRNTSSAQKNGLSYHDRIDDVPEDITYTFVKAQQGDFRSQFRLATAYKNGSDGLFQSYESAMTWLRKASEQGHAGAECEIGILYETGQGGVQKDDRAAVEWYRKAANRGYADAQKNLGFMYAKGWGVKEMDFVEAARWYRKAADQGHASAQFNLALLYSQGKGVPKDRFKACEWFRKSASQGHIQAQFKVGSMYFHGLDGVHSNYSEAMNQFQKAASGGHVEAQFHMGIMHANGLGVPQSNEKAVPWFFKAAEQSHAEAQSCLAVFYFKARGVVQDHEEALYWFLRAARQGHTPSMFNLGIIYSSQQFKNYSLAMNWYLKAADGGYKGAREAYEALRAQYVHWWH